MILSRYFSVFLTLLCLYIFCTDITACAQEKIDVRAGDHQGYSRLVLQGSAGGARVEKQGSALVITFKKAATANIGDVSTLKNIGSVSILSGDSNPLKLSVQIPSGSKFRDFKIGNRLMVDVYDASGEPSRDVAPKKITETKLKEEKSKEDKPDIEVEAPPSDDLKSTGEGGKLPANTQEILSRNPHVITVSSTRNIGLAVFERAGYLWIVQDDPSLKIPPAITGPNASELGKFEEIKVKAGKAYRLSKPKGAYLYGEGGGLLWRIVMTPTPRDKKPIKMDTRDVKKVDGVSRSLFWPLTTAQKTLNLTDPLIGDEIKVVTVADTGQTIGPARQLVEMKVLPSTVGMALVPYIDDLDIGISEEGVTLSKASGLSVSPLSDTAGLMLRDDIEKEGDMFDRFEKPRDMTKIFDFTRWEMGGRKALDNNRRILMVSAANKQGNTKVEDLITMAKLHLANDRGQEALGLLRVSEKELPGIEETPEFSAIRGAAGTLAGKYDEAIEDLSKENIQRYDEINYWKTTALAGLEDWQQADKVMPTNFTVLEEYPIQIKEPLALAMTEVALRAGNINIAERLLSMLEAGFSKMSISKQSAWKYFQGELERQAGNPEQALKNWEPLLTGRDDYYRAKAGLSVIRMQLERQKITPAKAIDRLEGLRYAWRGDELETLINLRLGEVYVNNKEYLKGLSVLRNAVGLSPNSKISQDVTDYMTVTFRNLFTDGTLNDLSPLDAVSIYDEFKELTPVGEEGDVFVQNLAERLVNVDLLGRAAALLEDQMNYRVKGVRQVTVGIRLAAIRLLDQKPDGALQALDVAEGALKDSGGDAMLLAEIKMLRARALSKKGEANKALSLLRGLPNSENMAKLRADIAWNGGLWNDAANAFDSLIGYQNISLTRPMDEYQENLVLNRAIALNLSGNRSGIAKLRAKYNDLMSQSEKARIFNLVTRPRQLGVLSDRDSITSLISEVDLFGGFLENYKGSP